MSKKVYGLVVSELNASVKDAERRKKIFDSRDFVFRFVNRREYREAVSVDGKYAHKLGYPPFTIRYVCIDEFGDESTDLAASPFMTESSSYNFQVDKDYIYTSVALDPNFPTDKTGFNLNRTLIGTDNLYGVADMVVEIDGSDGTYI